MQKDLNGNKNSKSEDEEEIDTKIFNGLLIEDKKSPNNTNNNNEKLATNEKKNSRNLDAYINENSNLFDLNFISFGDVNSLYNFQNGKIDINKQTELKNINLNNKFSPYKNKLNFIINSPKKVKNGSEEKYESPSSSPSQTPSKSKRKNSNGSLLNQNNDNKENNNSFFLNKQIFKLNNLFGNNNIRNENDNEIKKEIVSNYWESKNFFRISEINKGNAILVSEDDNIINFPAFLLPKGVKIGETYTFEIKSMDKGFIYKNQKANEIEDIQKKFLNSEDMN
jgi:hypothetical protein